MPMARMLRIVPLRRATGPQSPDDLPECATGPLPGRQICDSQFWPEPGGRHLHDIVIQPYVAKGTRPGFGHVVFARISIGLARQTSFFALPAADPVKRDLARHNLFVYSWNCPDSPI